MYADVAAQTEKMQFAVVFFNVVDEFGEFFFFKERPIANRLADSDRFLIDDSSCPDILMAYFAVAHCSGGKSHIFAAGMNETMRILAHQPAVGRHIRLFYSVISVILRIRV